jgi:hypothetical protein
MAYSSTHENGLAVLVGVGESRHLLATYSLHFGGDTAKMKGWKKMARLSYQRFTSLEARRLRSLIASRRLGPATRNLNQQYC